MVIDGLWKERLYRSIVSKATVSLMIVKLGSPWECAPCAVKLIVLFTSTPDISTVEGWVPIPEITRYWTVVVHLILPPDTVTVKLRAIVVLNIIVISDTTPWFSLYEYKLWPKLMIITKKYN